MLRFDDIYCQLIQVERVEEAIFVDITEELEDDYDMLDDIENIFKKSIFHKYSFFSTLIV